MVFGLLGYIYTYMSCVVPNQELGLASLAIWATLKNGHLEMWGGCYTKVTKA